MCRQEFVDVIIFVKFREGWWDEVGDVILMMFMLVKRSGFNDIDQINVVFLLYLIVKGDVYEVFYE